MWALALEKQLCSFKSNKEIISFAFCSFIIMQGQVIAFIIQKIFKLPSPCAMPLSPASAGISFHYKEIF
jgi:hypothetical protein